MQKILFVVTTMFTLFAQQSDIETLINQLQEVRRQGIGYHGSVRRTQFLPVTSSSQMHIGIIGTMGHEQSNLLTKIVSRGCEAIPFLLKHLDDRRMTKIPPLYAMMWQQFSAEYDWNPNNCKVDHNQMFEQQKHKELVIPRGYTITVGDLCFVALGQIVNRHFEAVRYQPTGGLVINSPSRIPYLCEVAREEWGNLSQEQHKNSLIRDFTSGRRVEAYIRLWYYYPSEAQMLALKTLANSKNIDAHFIKSLSLDGSEKINNAVHKIFLNISNDDSLAIACAERLIGYGYEEDINRYIDKRLQKIDASPKLLEIQQKLSQTRLHNAVRRQNHGEVQRLLETSDIDINAVGYDGKTALHITAQLGDIRIVELLLKHKADLNIRDRKKWTPVQYAAQKFHKEIVVLLANSGCEISDILVASFAGNIHKVKELLQDSNTSDAQQDLLHVAVWIANDKLVTLLLENGWDVNSKNSRQLTPLHVVFDVNIAKILLKHGADLEAKNRLGFSPLHFAILEQRLEIAKLLIDQGAKIHEKDKWRKNTPLMWSAYRRDTKTMKFLLKYRRQTESWYLDIQEALQMAKYNVYNDIIDLLTNF